MCAPPRPKIFSISCSFSQNLAKSYVGTPAGWLAPPPTGNPGSAPGTKKGIHGKCNSTESHPCRQRVLKVTANETFMDFGPTVSRKLLHYFINYSIPSTKKGIQGKCNSMESHPCRQRVLKVTANETFVDFGK